MRALKTILVIVLLGGLPVVSWLYLNKGKNWRKQAYEEISQNNPFDGLGCMTDGISLDTAFFSGYISILVKMTPDLPGNVIGELYSQFGKNEEIRFIVLGDVDRASNTDLSESGSHTLFIVPPPFADRCADGFDNAFGDAYNAALLDKSAKWRMRYNLRERADIRQLIKHVTVLLPIETRDKLELRYLKEDENASGK